MTKPRYFVLTHDPDRDDYTPQRGVRKGPHSLWGLKRALQNLRNLGYACNRQDPSVYVFREPNEQTAEENRIAGIKCAAQRVAYEMEVYGRKPAVDLFAATA